MLAACGAAHRSPSDRTAQDALSALLTDTSATGRVAFGCALQRGIRSADATTRHYGSMASRSLFTAALEDRHDCTVAARLWNANDALVPDDSDDARRRLLEICEEAGGAAARESAGMPELRAYMCTMNDVLAEERPGVDSYGAASTPQEPGDPRRTDAEFVLTAQFLLVRKDDEDWLDVEGLALAPDAGDEKQYATALEEMSAQCDRGPGHL